MDVFDISLQCGIAWILLLWQYVYSIYSIILCKENGLGLLMFLIDLGCISFSKIWWFVILEIFRVKWKGFLSVGGRATISLVI